MKRLSVIAHPHPRRARSTNPAGIFVMGFILGALAAFGAIRFLSIP